MTPRLAHKIIPPAKPYVPACATDIAATIAIEKVNQATAGFKPTVIAVKLERYGPPHYR